jgi:hypothetical protein
MMKLKFVSLNDACSLLGMIDANVLALLDAGEIAGKRTKFGGWRIGLTDIEVYAHDRLCEREQRTQEWLQRSGIYTVLS